MIKRRLKDVLCPDFEHMRPVWGGKLHTSLRLLFIFTVIL